MKESQWKGTAGPPLRFHGKPGQIATVGVCDSFIFSCSLRPGSSQEHLPTSIAGVPSTGSGQALRLRAINPSVCDRSVRRFAQDDDFIGGLEVQLVGYTENAKGSKKSQLTTLFAW